MYDQYLDWIYVHCDYFRKVYLYQYRMLLKLNKQNFIWLNEDNLRKNSVVIWKYLGYKVFVEKWNLNLMRSVWWDFLFVFSSNLRLNPNIFDYFVAVLQKTVYGANVVIFEGILAFYNKELMEVSTINKWPISEYGFFTRRNFKMKNK